MSKFDKNNLSEKIKNWKKEKLVPWIKDRFNSSENHNNYNQMENFNYKTGSKFNITINNITINKNKNSYTRNIGLPNNSTQKSTQKLLDNNINSFDSIYSRFSFIKDLYNKQKLEDVFVEIIYLLKDLMKIIANFYSFGYRDMEDFLRIISNLNGRRFLIYDELNKIFVAQKQNYMEYEKPTADLVKTLYFLIEKIIIKLKNNWKEDLNRNFYELNNCRLIE